MPKKPIPSDPVEIDGPLDSLVTKDARYFIYIFEALLTPDEASSCMTIAII